MSPFHVLGYVSKAPDAPQAAVTALRYDTSDELQLEEQRPEAVLSSETTKPLAARSCIWGSQVTVWLSAAAHAAEMGWLFPKPDTASTALPKVPSLLVQGKRTMSPETATTREEPSKASERNMLTAATADSLSPSDEQNGETSPICTWARSPRTCYIFAIEMLSGRPFPQPRQTRCICTGGTLCLLPALRRRRTDRATIFDADVAGLSVNRRQWNSRVRHQLLTADSFPMAMGVVDKTDCQCQSPGLVVTSQLAGMREITGDAAVGFNPVPVCCGGIQPYTLLES